MISFLINRSRRHWQVLSTLVLGVLISTAFLACGPLIVNTVMNFALPHKIRSSQEENGSVFLSTYSNTGASIIRLLRDIADQFGVTVIVASHDPNMIQFADTIIELQDG